MRCIYVVIVGFIMIEAGCGCHVPRKDDGQPQHAAWGDDDYSVVPLIRNTPSMVWMNRKTENGCVMSTFLAEDKSYYEVVVGEDVGDHCDRWFDLKVTRDGRVYRMITDPHTLEWVWVPDTWEIANANPH